MQQKKNIKKNYKLKTNITSLVGEHYWPLGIRGRAPLNLSVGYCREIEEGFRGLLGTRLSEGYTPNHGRN